MKYQAIKHNKTGSRVLGIFDTLPEARAAIRAAAPRAMYRGESYMGGFPYYHDTETQDARPYTIQGSVDIGGQSVVCSLRKEDVQAAAVAG